MSASKTSYRRLAKAEEPPSGSSASSRPRWDDTTLEPLPADPANPQSDELRHTGSVPIGGSYMMNEGATPHPIGIYTRPQGQKLYVKGIADGLAIDQNSYLSSSQGDRQFPKRVRTNNGAIRKEFVAHKLYDAIATPRNKIAGLPVKLLSGQTRREVSGTDHKDPSEFMYMASPALSGVSMDGLHDDDTGQWRYYDARTKSMRPFPHLPGFEPEREIAKGSVADAWLGMDDITPPNVFFTTGHEPGKHRVCRIDTGIGLGWEAADEHHPDHEAGLLRPETASRMTLLPDLVRILPEHISNGHIDGESILRQAHELITSWESRQPAIQKALEHAPRPDTLWKQLDARIQSLRNMIEVYGTNPQGLVNDLLYLSRQKYRKR